MKLFVLGFLFDQWGHIVLLIRKNRPAWQAGKLNGIGGKVEKDETPNQAMVREFREETGMTVKQWTSFCTLRRNEETVFCYCAKTKRISEAQTKTDEFLDYVPTFNLGKDVLYNVRWMVPMAKSVMVANAPLAPLTDPPVSERECPPFGGYVVEELTT